MPLRTSDIACRSQQTRFDPLQGGVSALKRELDLKDVSISIGNREILSDAHIKLNAGVRYVLHARNGQGKSTILRAISERLIPGIPLDLRIACLQQRDEDAGSSLTPKGDAAGNGPGGGRAGQAETPSQLVVRSDTDMMSALRKRDRLQAALDDVDHPEAPAKLVRQLRHEDTLKQLEIAKSLAELRSGTRGSKARKALIDAENDVAATLDRLDISDTSTISIAHETAEAVRLLADVEADLQALSADTAQVRADGLLRGLGFSAERMHQPLSALSDGWRVRARLAAALFKPCHLLLLDEPTSFLDFSSVLWLESHLAQALPIDTALLLVTHDRALADRVADETIVMRDAQLEYFAGNLSVYYEEREKKTKWMTSIKEAQERQTAHMEKTIQGNLRAAKRSGDDKKLKQVASRQKKLEDRMGLQVSAKGTRFKLNRDLAGYHTSKRAEIEIPKDEVRSRFTLPTAKLSLGPAKTTGPLVSCDNLGYTYRGSEDPLFKGFSMCLRAGERVGFIGENGAGKSTLLSCLFRSGDASQLGKIDGTVSLSSGVAVGHFSQSHVDTLPSALTALAVMALPTEQEARSALASLGLAGKVVSDVPISQLSGGQRVRVALARILFPIGPDILVLDEISTHLDADTVQNLASELRHYHGAVCLVSHDRWFLEAVLEEGDSRQDDEEEGGVNDRISSEGTLFWLNRGKVKRLEGGMHEFEEKMRRRAVKMR